MSGITKQGSRRQGASAHDYIEAWKFCVGTAAGGRGGGSAENQPVTERAAHCGIRWTVAVALRNEPITVFGGGAQTRSFCDVRDTVVALNALANRARADTVIANVGNDREISILDLARLVIERAGSRSTIRDIGLREAYGEDFEDIRRRRPSLDRLRNLTGFKHRYTLEETIDDLIAVERQGLIEEKDGHCTLVRHQSERAA